MRMRKLLILLGVLACVALPCNAKYVGIHAAAASGDIAKLQEYLAKDPGALTSTNGAARGALCVAAMCGQKAAVEFLIGKGADVNRKGFMEMTALADLASLWGLKDDGKCAEIAEVLISHGAAVDPIDRYHKTPLLWAAEAGKPRLTELLLRKGANVGQRMSDSSWGSPTALHLAVQNHRKEVVQVLLKHNAPLNAREQSGHTALTLAVMQNDSEIADLLRAESERQGLLPKVPAPPSKEQMRGLAERVATGENSAFEELSKVADAMYRDIDYGREEARVLVNLSRMRTAFDVLGTEAGKGNDKAFAALKRSLGVRRLDSFAPDGLAVAAAAGHKEALDILLNYDKWGILDSSAGFALCTPAKANVTGAVDYLAALLTDPERAESGVGLMAVEALKSAAAKGNDKAKSALEAYQKAHPNN